MTYDVCFPISHFDLSDIDENRDSQGGGTLAVIEFELSMFKEKIFHQISFVN